MTGLNNGSLPLIKKTGKCHTGKIVEIILEKNRVICKKCKFYLGDIKK